MTEVSKKVLLDKLIAEKATAFSDGIPNAPLLTSIISQLNSLNRQDKPYFKEYATNLKKELFSKSVTIKGLDLSQFEPDSSPIVNESHGQDGSRIIEVKTEFTELLKNLALNLTEQLDVLKGHFMIRLENNPFESYKLIVLYDEHFFYRPLKKKIEKLIPTTVFKKLEELSDDIQNGRFQEGNVLCLLLLLPRTNDGEGLKTLRSNLEPIINYYKSFESFAIKPKSDLKGAFFESSISKEDFYEEIGFVNSTLLSDGEIKHEEEKIIKKLFRNFHTPLLVYKTLKGGNSGSKVIEIRPKKELGNEYEKRYIIKYSEKNFERKIKKEYECFGRWVDGYKGFSEYICKYEHTLTHEGIQYSYAISDSERESYSYKDIISKKDNPFHSKKIELIDQLFSINLYTTWRDSLESVEGKVSDLYSSYVNPEKVQEELIQILNLPKDEIERQEIWINFKKVWESRYKFQQKVCHGDLHSDNFFVDNNGTYLIDFGFTGERHAVIDHTSLECSIKFKHFPFYLPIQELTELEEELLLDTSFQLSTRFNKTNRANIIEMLEIIKKIRNNSIPLIGDGASMTEYFISLFIMTFRQIRYKDMNQQYAYISALILSRRVVQLMGL